MKTLAVLVITKSSGWCGPVLCAHFVWRGLLLVPSGVFIVVFQWGIIPSFLPLVGVGFMRCSLGSALARFSGWHEICWDQGQDSNAKTPHQGMFGK
eukprot:9664169-Lingulodinium_polyedra.AAC.1